MIVAIAWVGLCSYPAYATEENPVATQDSIEKSGTSQNIDAKTINKQDSSEVVPTQKGNNDTAVKKTPKQKKPISKTMVIIIMLTLLVLGVSFLSLWLVYTRLQKLLFKVQENVSAAEDKCFAEYTMCQDEIKTCKRAINELKTEINNLKIVVSKLSSAMQTRQHATQEINVPIQHQERFYYGKYEPVNKGFSIKYLKTQPEASSQFVIRLTSETSAEFRLIENISRNVLEGVIDACLIDGDLMNFSKVEMVNNGRLTLEDDTWIVVDKAHIKVY